MSNKKLMLGISGFIILFVAAVTIIVKAESSLDMNPYDTVPKVTGKRKDVIQKYAKADTFYEQDKTGFSQEINNEIVLIESVGVERGNEENEHLLDSYTEWDIP